ncbi:MAG: glycyl-radical enzyme activating protein [Chloroflexota bacterium]
MTETNELKGVVFDIQKYSIHDGPGIRTTVFLKGCPLTCFWCQNPESQMVTPQIFLYADKCTRCGRCLKVCTTGAITISETSSQVDRDKCIGCGQCAEVCPNEARRLAGKYMTVDEVVREVMKDVKFYKNSGGGVTLSGGDPLFQSEFALQILQKCKQNGLHTVVETCGFVPWTTLEKVLPYVDLFLFDIKHIDSGKHKKGTQKPNELIIENIRKIAACKPVIVRTPLIPGFNDSPGDIESIARFVKSELHSPMEILAYNKMGEGKYERLGRKPIPLSLQDEQLVQSLKDLVSQICGNEQDK